MATKKAKHKTTKRKVLAKPIHKLKTFNFFVAFAAVLGMMAGVLMVQTFYEIEKPQYNSVVELGGFEYDFKDNKGTKLTDTKTKSLRTLLTAEADNSGCAEHIKAPGMYIVRAYTEDRSQVLLGYGCGQVSSSMFAVLKDGEWQTISPTNKFDVLTDVPECGYLKQYRISKQIAPVCFSAKGTIVSYEVR